MTPDKVKSSVTSDQYRLYRLIWSRFISSQMTNAVYDSVTVDVNSAGYIFRATNSVIKFSGFTAVYEEGRDDERVENTSPLPQLEEGEPLKLEDIKKEQKFTLAAVQVYGGHAHQGHGGNWYRAAEYLRPDDFNDPRPRIRRQGGAVSPSDGAGERLSPAS